MVLVGVILERDNKYPKWLGWVELSWVQGLDEKT